MYLLVSGFRYKQAGLEVRERFSFGEKELSSALRKLLEYPSIKEAVILSTCNRTEIYTLVEDTEIASGSIVRFLADYHNLDISEIRKYMFTLMHDDTIRQLYKVTSGIDSMVIGETQIFNQVKQAFNAAREAKSVDVILTKLFKSAFTASKKVRSQTKLKSLISDISSGAIELARLNVDGNFQNQNIMIIGAGKMASLALKYLVAKYEHSNIKVLNRTAKPLESIYANYKVAAGTMADLKEQLTNTNILLVATSAPHYIVRPEHISDAKKLIVVDISVPRNVDPEIANIKGVRLFNTDDIQQLVEQNSKEKDKMLAIAEQVVKEEAEKFNSWMMTLDIIPTIKKVRSKIETIRQNRIEKARSKVCPYSNDRCQVIEELSKQLVNNILHDPTVRIKANQSHEQLFQTAKLLNDLFNLEEEALKVSKNE